MSTGDGGNGGNGELKIGTRTLVMFPETMYHLQVEIMNHPRLQELLARAEDDTLEAKIAVIATYCDVLVDGYLVEKELEKLFDLLLKKLKSKSGIIVH